MPAKHFWTKEQLCSLYDDFYSDLTSSQVGQKYGVDYSRSIKPIWLALFGEPALKQRFKQNCSKSKLDLRNPMYQQTGKLHPRWKPAYLTSDGYVMVDVPENWTGARKAGKWLEHVIVACQQLGLTELPSGFVVHHKDGDKQNNAPENLELLSRSEHLKLHYQDPEYVKNRKVQRLSRKGVGSKQSRSALRPSGR